MTHPSISLRFRVTARRVNKFCFSLISLSVCKKSLGLVYAQFWCHLLSTYLVWIAKPQISQQEPKSRPGVISSRALSRKIVNYFLCFGFFWSCIMFCKPSWFIKAIRSICQVVTYMSRRLQNQTKLKFDQDLKAHCCLVWLWNFEDLHWKIEFNIFLSF